MRLLLTIAIINFATLVSFSQSVILPKNNTITTDTTVFFQWNSVDCEHYQLMVATDVNFASIELDTTTTHDSIILELTSGQKFWKVRYFSEGTYSNWSKTSHFTLLDLNELGQIRFHFKSDSNIILNNDEIAEWNDISGNSISAVQTTEASQPLLIDNVLNNYPAVRFDGSDDNLLINQNTLLGSLFILTRWNGAAIFPTYNGLFNAQSSTIIFDGDPGTENLLLDYSPYFGDNIYVNSIKTNDLNPLNEFKIISGVKSIPQMVNNYIIGNDRDVADRYWNGDIVEIILYEDALNDSLKNIVEQYLNQKYVPPVNLGENIYVSSLCDTILDAEQSRFNEYLWSTGESTSTVTVSNPGVYSVTVTNFMGYESSDSVEVFFSDFNTLKNNNLCLGDSIEWNTGLSNTFNFEWYNHSSSDSAIFITETGDYAVKVTDTNSCVIISDTITVSIDSFPAKTFLRDTNYQCSGATIGLDRLPEPGTSFLWNTGSIDSTTVVDTSGNYALLLTNPRGCQAYDTTYVDIIGTAPDVNFEADTACFAAATQFTDLSVPVAPDTLSAWLWDFGDGNTDTLQHPTHTYASVDTFNATLTVYSGECSNTLSKEIFVKPIPTADFGFRFADSILCVQNSPLFENYSTATVGDTLSYLWNFGDGTSSTDSIPQKSYTSGGTYSMQLKTSQENGCTDSITRNIEVIESAPAPDIPQLISPADNAYTQKLTNDFHWSATANTHFYSFEFAGDTFTIKTDTSVFTHTATENGKYNWQVKAFNVCKDSTVSDVHKLNIGMPLENRTLAWYVSDSTYIESGYVDTLYDISGHRNHAVQGNSTYKPILVDSPTINNFPFLKFQRDYLIAENLNLNFDSIVTIISIFQKTATNNGMRYYEHSSGGVFGDYAKGISALDYNGDFYATHTNGNPPRSQAILPYPAQDTFMIVAATHDRTKSSEEVELFINGSNQGINYSHDDNMDTTFSTEDFYIGGDARLSVGDMLQGNFLEIIIISGEFHNETRDSIHQYLRYKYAPPVNLGANITVDYGFPDTTITTADKGWFTDFQWSTGPDDTLSTLTVSEEGTYAVTVTDIFGFESSDSLRVFYPEFNVWNDRSICLGDTLVWDLEPKGPYAYAWSTGSSDSAIAISEAGTYSVTITDTLGNSWSPGPVTVSIDSFPATATLGPDTTLCSGNRLELAVGQGEASQFLWHDGSTQPYYLIDETETIGLEVTNTLGCVAHDTITVDVAGTAPRANYSFDRLCRDVDINFTNLSEAYDGATITSHNWNFNETGSSSNINPVYSFADTGDVAVTLTVETDQGCANDTTRMLDIHELPTPDFNPVQVCENATLQLQNQSVSVDGNITNYTWQINDSLFNEAEPTYTFSEAGTVPVQLTAITEHDCPDTLNTNITIKPAPEANFAYDTACAGRVVNFNNLSTTNLGQQYTSQWQLEESIASDAQHPTHIFDSTGLYEVKLIVQQLGDGCTDTLQKQISVHALPTAIITDQSGCEGTPHELQHASTWGEGEQSGTTTWLVADTTITGEPAFYTTNETGTQQIKLIAQNASGCMDTSEYEYTTNSTPEVAFASVNDTVYIPASIELANLSDPAAWQWTLNDTLFSEAYAPTLNLDTEGTYIITLTGTDDNGCYNVARDTTEALVPFIDGTLMECRAIIDQGRLYVSVEMANIGSKNITNPELRLTLSNGQMFAETYSGIIYPGREETYSFRTQYLLPENTTLEWIITELIYESDQAQANNSCSYIFGEMPQIFNPYPNPVDGTLHLDFTAVDQGNARLRLYNLMGEIVMDKTIEANKGLNRLQIPNPSPNGGVHTLEVTVNGTRKTFRIVL